MTRWMGLLTVLAVVFGAAAGCFLQSDSPDDTLTGFADALSRGDVAAAAEHTTDPGAASAAIQSMLDGMGPTAKLTASGRMIDDKKVTGTVDFGWTIRDDRSMRYQSTAVLEERDSTWLVRWQPDVLHPSLRDGHTFSYSDDMDYRTPVLDRNGRPLMTWQPVSLIQLHRDHLDSADRVARVLRTVEPGMTGDGIRRQFTDSPDAEQTVIRLRSRDLAEVRTSLKAIDGVSFSEQGALLSATRALHSPAMTGLEESWRDTITRTAGWSVSLIDARGTPTDVLKQVSPQPTPALRTELDRDIQTNAQRAVDVERRPAVIVAIAPSTGAIVAVAQNSAADRTGAIALSGLYPPGSTFKTVTTAAGLARGAVRPQTALPCPGRATIEGRTIPNEDDFDLGLVPLSSAFAHSCNTTMGALANRLPADALPGVARELGIGVDYVIPGITTVTGRVPAADTPSLRVENGIGQGTVAVSPFGLAVAEASLARGETVTPTLISGRRTTTDSPTRRLPADVVRDLRSMMRQTVASGTATALRDVPGLGGKTGTAEYGDNKNPHGWFAGIVGDLAFATLVVGGGSSEPAVSVTGRFLRPLVS
ncbi:penicillin-binding transpeptidase domain-containing protein [Gordonia sp. SL306]|uniref:penicillin-binding transpeptidase domain-containing protein n=1 Tax=Gordonia sp. SL306 TaxID=2995145 RepID=UPI00226E4570|nr:penicillin-binding transpeptidase domain-containing protein [Gordonia sp. SL306]WAC57605.1 penicillin-binding transpeptidase domain-containing protein [Gordonia sp. SL306]